MTQKQFIAAWRDCIGQDILTRYNARISLIKGEIRVNIPSTDADFCPLTWVVRVKLGKGLSTTEIDGAAGLLGVDEELRKDIVDAADTRKADTLALRRALVAAMGQNAEATI